MHTSASTVAIESLGILTRYREILTANTHTLHSPSLHNTSLRTFTLLSLTLPLLTPTLLPSPTRILANLTHSLHPSLSHTALALSLPSLHTSFTHCALCQPFQPPSPRFPSPPPPPSAPLRPLPGHPAPDLRMVRSRAARSSLWTVMMMLVGGNSPSHGCREHLG